MDSRRVNDELNKKNHKGKVGEWYVHCSCYKYQHIHMESANIQLCTELYVCTPKAENILKITHEFPTLLQWSSCKVWILRTEMSSDYWSWMFLDVTKWITKGVNTIISPIFSWKYNLHNFKLCIFSFCKTGFVNFCENNHHSLSFIQSFLNHL